MGVPRSVGVASGAGGGSDRLTSAVGRPGLEGRRLCELVPGSLVSLDGNTPTGWRSGRSRRGVHFLRSEHAFG